FNDAHGHLQGDEVLCTVAGLLHDAVRNVDLVGRYGGEEFVVLLPQVGKPDALRVAEKLRTAILTHAWAEPITISIGVATCPADSRTVVSLLDASDRALFAAKRAGRNCVVGFSPDLPAQAQPTAVAQ